jgi:hypothetical protein
MKVHGRIVTVGLIVVVIATLGTLITIRTQNHPAQRVEPIQQPQISHMTNQSIKFIENQGQWDPEVSYMARKKGMTAWLLKDGITFQFEKRDAQNNVQGVILQMTFEGASEWASLTGEEKQQCKYNYFIGKDQAHWRSNVPSYAQVIYSDLYDNVDLGVREEDGWLEYDLLLSPRANLHDVVIRCEGLKKLRIDENGCLVMETEFGPITQKPAIAWHESYSGERIPVACNFRIIDNQHYGFEVEHDLGLALVIDPGIEWATFLGGNDADHCMAMDVTDAGEIIIAGATESADFPSTYGAYDTTFQGGTFDGFVSCLSTDGSNLIWSTALGGTAVDALFDVAVDNQGRVIVAGLTTSPDFHTTSGAYDTTYNGSYDGVIACLDSTGSQLLYSTFLGTSSQDMIMALDVSSSGDAIVSGYTSSPIFPTTSGAYDTTYNGGVYDAFLTRINADGTHLIYSTYLGGSNNEGWNYQYPLIENTDLMSVLLDGTENVIVCGMTASSDFPTTSGAYDITHNGDWDIFAAKFDASCSNLIFSTYVGGSSWDALFGNAMCLRENGHIAIGGATASQNFPTTQDAFDMTFNGGVDDWDAFISQLDSTGSQLLYSTFIGGTGPETGDVIMGMAFDANGTILFAGQAEFGFPTTPGAYDTVMDGPYDICVGRLSPSHTGQDDLIYCSYIGGDSAEGACDLTLVDDSTAVLVGFVISEDFPVTSAAYDTSYGGVWDGFILRFGAYVGIQEEPTQKPTESIILSSVFPNPSYRQFTFGINLKQSQEVQLRVFDITGRFVETLVNTRLPAGMHEFAWQPAEEVPSGTYFLELKANDHNETRKVLLVR